jgi:hypothetical protein
MTAKERRRALYERIREARSADPEVFGRQATAPESIARQAFHSSLIEGCDVRLDQLRSAAETLAKCNQ